MKQLDEMERMATSRVESEQRDLRDIAECRRMEALNTLTGAARDATIAAADLARALLAVMPTVRAALDWHRVNTGQHTNGPQHTLAMRDTRRALVDAIDTLRRGMGEE